MAATFVRFSPVKVNLFLEVHGRRPDGYHEVVTVMEALDFGDEVAVSPAPKLEVSSGREDVPDGEANLACAVIRAAERRLGRDLSARIELRKSVPPGTGLGAGSSNAAAALAAVLRLHGIDVPAAVRRRIAADTGSDVPFFVSGGTAVCRGRGERVEPLRLATQRNYVLSWRPGLHVATRAVYAALEPPETPAGCDDLLRALSAGEPPQTFNRLEAAARAVCPELEDLAGELEQIAGRRPTLCGSGAAFFLLVPDDAAARELARRISRSGPHAVSASGPVGAW